MSQAHLAKILLLINSYSLMQKRGKKIFEPPIVPAEKEITRQRLGPLLLTNAVSSLKHTCDFSAGYSPLEVLPWFCLPSPCYGCPFPALPRTDVSFGSPPSSFSKWWAALDPRLPFCLAPRGCVQHLLSPLRSCCGEPGCLSRRSPCPGRALSACRLVPVLLGSRFAAGFAPPCQLLTPGSRAGCRTDEAGGSLCEHTHTAGWFPILSLNPSFSNLMLHLHLPALFVFLLLWFCGSPEAEAEDCRPI